MDPNKIVVSSDLKDTYKNRNFSDIVFFQTAHEDLKLSDLQVAYNNGKTYKIVDLNFFEYYPVLHDKYFDQIDKQVYDITISVCPYTLCATVFFGKFFLTDKTYLNQIILYKEGEENLLLVPIIGKYYSLDTKSLVETVIRREEAKILTVKDALKKFVDVKFSAKIKPEHKSNLKPLKSIFESKDTKYIPYGVNYISGSTDYELKQSIIIPNKNSMSIKENGIDDYLHNMINKIREKGGIIIPCSESTWFKFYPNSKKIQLN